MWEEYRFVDVKHKSSRQWARILRADLERWVQDNAEKVEVPGHDSNSEREYMSVPEDMFCTIQTFKGAESRDNEPHIAPFFVDFDADSLEQALQEARQLVDYFLVGHEVEPQVWFSGNRGFHVTVEAVAFGAEPSPDLTYIWRHLAERLVKQLGLTTLDKRVYSRRRMWRVAGTKHSKSGLYKIPLSLSVFRTETIDGIRQMAEQPVVLAERNGIQEVQESNSLKDLFRSVSTEFKERQKVIESTQVEYFFPVARRRVCNSF